MGNSQVPRSSCTFRAKFSHVKENTVGFLEWQRKMQRLWRNPGSKKLIYPLTLVIAPHFNIQKCRSMSDVVNKSQTDRVFFWYKNQFGWTCEPKSFFSESVPRGNIPTTTEPVGKHASLALPSFATVPDIAQKHYKQLVSLTRQYCAIAARHSQSQISHISIRNGSFITLDLRYCVSPMLQISYINIRNSQPLHHASPALLRIANVPDIIYNKHWK